MAEKKKNKRSFTGLKGFLYGVLNEDEDGIEEDEATSVEFIQNISVETPQSISKAAGDNKIAEMAVSTDATTLTTQFHTISIEDKRVLYGLKDVDGLTAVTSNPVPPYVACMFARTAEDGGTEWLGFTKGIFTMPETEQDTKEPGEDVEFNSQESEGEFMSREIEGLDEEVTYLMGYDAPDETDDRDALYKVIFGVEHPDKKEDTP